MFNERTVSMKTDDGDGGAAMTYVDMYNLQRNFRVQEHFRSIRTRMSRLETSPRPAPEIQLDDADVVSVITTAPVRIVRAGTRANDARDDA